MELLCKSAGCIPSWSYSTAETCLIFPDARLVYCGYSGNNDRCKTNPIWTCPLLTWRHFTHPACPLLPWLLTSLAPPGQAWTDLQHCFAVNQKKNRQSHSSEHTLSPLHQTVTRTNNVSTPWTALSGDKAPEGSALTHFDISRVRAHLHVSDSQGHKQEKVTWYLIQVWMHEWSVQFFQRSRREIKAAWDSVLSENETGFLITVVVCMLAPRGRIILSSFITT